MTSSDTTRTSTTAEPIQAEEYVPSWRPLDIETLLDDEYQGPKPALWRDADGNRLLYRGAVHTLFGQPESWKSWLGLHAIADTLGEGERALLIDAEEHAQVGVFRLRKLGATKEQLRRQFAIVEPFANPHTEGEQGAFLALVSERYDLVVIDSVTRTGALSGIKSNDQDSVTHWFNSVPNAFARAGAAVVVIDHVPKPSNERAEGAERYAGGSNAKLGIVQVGLRVDRIAGKDHPKAGAVGYVQMAVTKDRHSGINEHHELFDVTVDSTDPERVDVRIAGRVTEAELTEDDLHANARAAIIRALQVNAGGLGVAALRKEAHLYKKGKPIGRADNIDDAAKSLEADAVVTRKVEGKATITRLTEEWAERCRAAGIPIPSDDEGALEELDIEAVLGGDS